MRQPTSASVTVERGPFEMVPHWLLDAEVSAQAVRLYLLMRRHGDKTGTSFPGRKRLAEQLHASPSTVDRAKAELIDVGALCEQRRMSEDGDWTSNLYHVHWDRAAGCTRFGYPAGGEGSPACGDTSPVYGDTGAPPVVNELIPNMNLDPLTHTGPAADAAALTEGQLVNTLAKHYTDRVPLSNFPAVAGVVRKAVRTQRYTTQQITDALERMADDNRPVTVDALRIELEGMPDPRRRKSGTAMYLDLAQQLADQPNDALRALGQLGGAQ